MSVLSCLLLAVSVSVGYDAGNLPKIFVDGVPHAPLIDNCGHASGRLVADYGDVDSYLAHSLKVLGPRILNMGITDWSYRREDGRYDWGLLDERAKALLALDPEAKLMIGIRFVYQKWAETHPDECVAYGGHPIDPTSGDEWAGAPKRPSAASLAFRREVFRDLAALAEHVRRAPWGERVICVRPCYGVATEWFSYGTVAYPDEGKPMARFFREYLRKAYGTDAALRRAWKDERVTLDAATIPSRAERTSGTLFLDAERNRRTIDFNKAMAEAMAELLVAVGNEIKRLLPGRIVGVYHGYVLNAWPSNSANFLLDRVMSSGAIDFFSDPPDYARTVRRAGGDFGHKTVVSTLRRYGKIGVIEDDSRLSFMSNWVEKGWAMADAREDRAVLRRNVLNTLFDREGYQICDPGAPSGNPKRPHFFDGARALADQKEVFDVLRSVRSLPGDSGNDMALVVHYHDKFYTDTQLFIDETNRYSPNVLKWWTVYRDTPLRFHQTGAAFDLMTLEDLLASSRPYRKLVFLNGYALSAAEREAVKRLTRRPGVKSVWFVAPGSITDDGFSDEAMSELVGMKLTGAGANPQVLCADPAAQAVPGGETGWIKSIGDGAYAAFFPHVPQSVEDAGRVLDLIGEHRYVGGTAYVRRHGDYLMVHVGKPGRRTLTLPKSESGRGLTELFTGRTYPAGPVTLESDGPETWMFRLQ